MSTEERTAGYHVEELAKENHGSHRDIVIAAGDHLNETLGREGGTEMISNRCVFVNNQPKTTNVL